MTGLLLRDAELLGRGHADVRLAGGRIAEIGGGLSRRRGERVVECGGGALIPGLCDHHLHLHALAAWRRSVVCGPPAVAGPDRLAAALRDAEPDEHGWVRGVGYAESVAGDLDAAALDALRPGGPVRIQHRSGALWILNSAAVRAAGLASADHPGVERDSAGRPTGRLWRADDWLRTRLPAARPVDLGTVGRELARLGVTAVTDATPDLGAGARAAIEAAVRDGTLPQRVHLLGLPPDAGTAPHPRLSTGPYKIVLADSGLPPLDELSARIRHAHEHRRPVAVHCVTREALLLLLAAFDDTGTLDGDRIEHAALVPEIIVPELARRGLRVVTQPGFLADRGDDYLRDVPAEDVPDLYRCRSLLDAGVPVGLSSDAPYGPLDPWAVLDAAADRTTRSGAVAGRDETIPAAVALRSLLTDPGTPGGPPRQVTEGETADLVLLHVPLTEALHRPSAVNVRATIAGGRLLPE
ncbi:amidohydrolase family protein [Actinomadura livida]|uniref:Amidohydrolase family protein n=1 Tax=Actinomadura livida TaxID=79909 RepID=A0A7W7MXI7_9ACTN|nr:MULTISPECIES: amidohydrolase family protein [Actinomadura]MBB4774876.1 putative amidohydrolase YtcJ [Actinomadura catellatispora]GGU05447.1 amidohydrolase [Actinomadura livida]